MNYSEEDLLSLLKPHLKYLHSAEDLRMDQNLSDVGLDSMAAIDVLLEIEDAFGITLPDDKLVEEIFSTPSALWSVISELRRNAGQPYA